MRFQSGDKVRWFDDPYDLPWEVEHEFLGGWQEDDTRERRVLLKGPYGAMTSPNVYRVEKIDD